MSYRSQTDFISLPELLAFQKIIHPSLQKCYVQSKERRLSDLLILPLADEEYAYFLKQIWKYKNTALYVFKHV